MQTLGLSDSTPRTESRLKSLFWPRILNEGDVDYLTQQGFWICFLVALITLLSALVLQRYTGQGFGFVRLIFLALLLANIRGMLLSARWPKTDGASVPRLNVTLCDKLSDSMPTFLWPKTKYILYVFAMIEIAILVISLFAPIPKA